MEDRYEYYGLMNQEHRYEAAVREVERLISEKEMCARQKYMSIQEIMRRYDRPGGPLLLRDRD